MSFFKKVKNSDIETNSTEVLKNILMRKKQIASNNFNRYEDGNKIGLVVQGGNMRGIISGGALIGLESLGLTDVFDIVYGSSSGAINSTFFLTKQKPVASSFIKHLRPHKLHLTRFFSFFSYSIASWNAIILTHSLLFSFR